MTNTTIKYIDAPAGSGKTEIYIREALRLAQDGENVLLLFPTKNLTSEVKSRIDKANHQNVFVTAINDGKRPTHRLKEALEKPLTEGQIVLATHAAMIALPYRKTSSVWHLFIDETLDVFRATEMNVADTHEILTRHLSTGPSLQPNYYLLSVNDDGQSRIELARISKNNNNDEVFDKFKDAASLLLNEKWVNFALAKSYNGLNGSDGDSQKLAVYSLLSPDSLSGFRSVTVASALFTQSLMFLLWSRMGVTFVPAEHLMDGLRYRTHPNGSLVTFAYMTQRKWSKNLREKAGVSETVVKTVQDYFGDDRFIWARNITAQALKVADIDEMSVKSHGCNAFSDCHRCAALFSCNLKPDYSKFLESFGLGSTEIDIAIHKSSIYQSVMRVSLRNPDDRNPKIVVVSGKDDAEWLSSLFEGSKSHWLSNEIDAKNPKRSPGRKKIFSSNKEKVASHRHKTKKNEFLESIDIKMPVVGTHNLNHTCNEIAKDTYRDIVTLSIFDHVKSHIPIWQQSDWSNFSIKDWLFACHGRHMARKNHNQLATTAIFDPSLVPHTSRGLNNVVSINGIWLDYDKGGLTPYAFSSIFDDVEMVIYNTWTSTPDNNKWRAFIPTSNPMNVKEYEAVVRAIVAITDAQTGHGDGFDKSKFHAASLFYLPCQANHPEGSFFHDLHEGRGVLDPHEFLTVISWDDEPVVPFEPIELPEHVNQDAVEEAKRFWQSACGTIGIGNREFFWLACRLAWAGMSEGDLRSTLHAQAAVARSPKKREREINGVIHSLRAKGYLRS